MLSQRLVTGLLALTVCLGGSLRAAADLAWAEKTVELNGDARLPVLEAHFQFKNDGAKPVEIRNVESSCGCTTAALDKRVYEPGESGEIVAKYTVGTHTGLQRKTLLVITDEEHHPVTLTLVAHIQEILRVTPTSVSWSHNEALAPKHIMLELEQLGPIDEISVESSNLHMATRIVPLVKGRKYDLVLTPEQTSQFMLARLTIHCRFGADERTFVAYGTVKPETTE